MLNDDEINNILMDVLKEQKNVNVLDRDNVKAIIVKGIVALMEHDDDYVVESVKDTKIEWDVSPESEYTAELLEERFEEYMNVVESLILHELTLMKAQKIVGLL